MEKKEFDQRLSLIQSLRVEANKFRDEYKSRLNSLVNNSNDSLKTLETRDTAFIKYLQDVSDFNYSDKFTSPSDLFPGIRTASQMVDPEELKIKTDNMKEEAAALDGANKVAGLQVKLTMSDLRQALTAFSEYMTRANQIYDMELELLEDLDSIYDISDLKKSVVQ